MKKTRAQRNKERPSILSNQRALDIAQISFESDEDKLYLKSTFKIFNLNNIANLLVLVVAPIWIIVTLINNPFPFVIGVILLIPVPIVLCGIYMVITSLTSFVEVKNNKIRFRYGLRFNELELKPSMKIKIKRSNEEFRFQQSTTYYRSVELCLVNEGTEELPIFDFSVRERSTLMKLIA